jgi:hypothetical protein
MRHRLEKLHNLFLTIHYNLKYYNNRFKPGDIVYLEGLPGKEYLVLETNYNITETSFIHCVNMRHRNKAWYAAVWFIMCQPGKLTPLEAAIYNVKLPIDV